LHGAEHRCSIVVVMAISANMIVRAVSGSGASCRTIPESSEPATGPAKTARVRHTFPGNTRPDRPENADPNRAHSIAKHKALLAAVPTIASTDSDRDSHGVSDPSGRAEGHLGLAQRGRSRHGFLL
jgi:hypothetical protein